MRRLEEDGIRTLSDLARCEPSRKVSRVSAGVFERLRAQARLQLESAGFRVPLWQPRPPVPEEPRRGLAQMPPPSEGDVFFDLEGFPYAERGLEYLWGAVTVDEVTPVFHDWWAHDDAEERVAFEGFIDWLMERRRRYPDLHVYHYATYEESAIKRLMGKYATREAEVDELLRQGVLVDLLKVVRQGFVIGTPSYSLKHVERLYLPPRAGAGAVGGRVGGRVPEVDGQRRAQELAAVAAAEGDPGVQPGGLRVALGAPELAARPARRARHRVRARSAAQREAARAQARAGRGRGAGGAAGGAGDRAARGRRRGGTARPARRLAGRVPPARGEADVVAEVRSPRDDRRGAVRGQGLPGGAGADGAGHVADQEVDRVRVSLRSGARDEGRGG